MAELSDSTHAPSEFGLYPGFKFFADPMLKLDIGKNLDMDRDEDTDLPPFGTLVARPRRLTLHSRLKRVHKSV